MYDFIDGTVVERSPAQITLKAGPVGYRLTVPLTTFEALPVDAEARVFTTLLVRDERMELYGFATPAERELFLLLNGVSGIGPQMALKILSGLTPSAFVRAVAEENTAELTRVKGVGRKIADRLVFELKDTVAKVGCEGEPARDDEQVVSDAVVALVRLGFSSSEAQRAVRRARESLPGEVTCEGLIRRALA